MQRSGFPNKSNIPPAGEAGIPPESNQMARAWAVALLRRNGEDLTEENIRRVLSTRPKFSTIVRGSKAAAPPAAQSTWQPPASPPRTERKGPPAAQVAEPDPSLYRPSHIVHDPETSMARAWATAKLRRDGQPINEENIQRLLAERARRQGKSPNSPGSPPGEHYAPVPPTESVELQKFQALQAAMEEKEREAKQTVQALERQLSAAKQEIAELKEQIGRSLPKEEAEARMAEREAFWSGRLSEAEARQKEFEAERKRLNAELREKDQRLAEGESERHKLTEELVATKKALAELQGRIEEQSRGSSRLREEAAWLAGQLEEKSVALEKAEEKIATLRTELEKEKARTVGSSEEDRKEIERLRLLVSDLTGFEHEPGIECRKILVETLENELTLCLQRESALQMRANELELGKSGPQDASERQRLQNSIQYLRMRIDSLSTLIAESLAFLRRKGAAEVGDSDDEQPDNKQENHKPQGGL